MRLAIRHVTHYRFDRPVAQAFERRVTTWLAASDTYRAYVAP